MSQPKVVRGYVNNIEMAAYVGEGGLTGSDVVFVERHPPEHWEYAAASILPHGPDGAVGPVEPWMVDYLKDRIALQVEKYDGVVNNDPELIAAALEEILGGEDHE